MLISLSFAAAALQRRALARLLIPLFSARVVAVTLMPAMPLRYAFHAECLLRYAFHRLSAIARCSLHADIERAFTEEH